MIHPYRKVFNLELGLVQADETPQDDLAAQIDAQPRPGSLPKPSSSWLLINLVLYRDRQLWACKELLERFPLFFAGTGEPLEELFATSIPGMPDWYVVIADATWGEIVNDMTTEKIIINRDPDVAEHVVCPEDLPGHGPSRSPWDIAGRLATRAAGREIHAAVDELVAAGALLRTDLDGIVFEEIGPCAFNRLTTCVRRVSDNVRRFQDLWEDETNRLWLAVLIGDWPSAHEIAQSHDDPEVRRVVGEKFEAYRQRRIMIARCHLTLEPDSLHDLEVLFREEDQEFHLYVERAIQALGPDPELAELLLDTGDPRWNPQLFATLQGMSVNTELPDLLHVARELARVLLERGYRADDVLTTLLGLDEEPDRVAMIFLKHAPTKALPLVREALRYENVAPASETEVSLYGPRGSLRSRRRMAAALVTIDAEWSRQETLDALHELWSQHQDYPAIGPLILALGESRDLATRELGESWRAGFEDETQLENEEFTFHRELADVFQEAIALRGVSVNAEPGPQPGDDDKGQADTQAIQG